ncbi:MAG TPA: hypothetical protein VGK06_15225 [Methanosarcina sp.]
MSNIFYPNIVASFKTGSTFGQIGLSEKGRIYHEAAFEHFQLQKEGLKW